MRCNRTKNIMPVLPKPLQAGLWTLLSRIGQRIVTEATSLFCMQWIGDPEFHYGTVFLAEKSRSQKSSPLEIPKKNRKGHQPLAQGSQQDLPLITKSMLLLLSRTWEMTHCRYFWWKPSETNGEIGKNRPQINPKRMNKKEKNKSLRPPIITNQMFIIFHLIWHSGHHMRPMVLMNWSAGAGWFTILWQCNSGVWSWKPTNSLFILLQSVYIYTVTVGCTD